MSTSLEYWMTVAGKNLAQKTKPVFNYRRTKIVATVGPSTQKEEKLSQLVDSGVNVFRLNFSHGTHDYHKQTIMNIRSVMENKRKRFVAIMLDTKGPEIRTGNIEGENDVRLIEGDSFILTTNDEFIDKGNNQKVYVDYKNITKVVKEGDTVLVDDGLISLAVKEITEDELRCTIVNSGNLGSHKGVNLPGVKVDLPALTERDESDLKFGVRMGVDFIAASFVRKPEDIHEIRRVLGPKGEYIKIIAKIENAEGLENFDEILKVADGIMVARGDMGVEIPLEQVAMAQKMMIAKCNVAGKPVITATQMLESMVTNPRPTRAEATDVANAVMDGTDAVMLSGETAKGRYPIEAVKVMADICINAENSLRYDDVFIGVRKAQLKMSGKISVTETIASSAVKITNDIDAKLLLTITESGNTARLCAKYRPAPPIFAITQNKETARQLCLSWSITPVLVGSVIGTESIIKRTIMTQKEEDMLQSGDLIVVTSGHVEAMSGQTSKLNVITA